MSYPTCISAMSEGATFLEQAPTNTLLQDAWQQTLEGNVRPADLAASDEVLGKGRLALNLLDYFVRRIVQSPGEALRAALLDWGGSPETWELDGKCEVFDELAKLSPDADVIVAGHTHLRRQKRLPASGKARRPPLYLNTGTWIRLIRLDPKALTPEAFPGGSQKGIRCNRRQPPTLEGGLGAPRGEPR